jgi:transcriptional regulator with XRE-family HTH domain
MERNVEVGRRIRAARVLSGKEVRELASEIGVSKRTMWSLERGERLPDLLEAERIANATGQTIEFLLGGTSVGDNQEGPTLPLLPGAVNPDQEA